MIGMTIITMDDGVVTTNLLHVNKLINNSEKANCPKR